MADNDDVDDTDELDPDFAFTDHCTKMKKKINIFTDEVNIIVDKNKILPSDLTEVLGLIIKGPLGSGLDLDDVNCST